MARTHHVSFFGVSDACSWVFTTCRFYYWPGRLGSTSRQVAIMHATRSSTKYCVPRCLGPQVTTRSAPRTYLPLGEKALLGGFRSCNFALFKNAYSRSVAQKRGFSTPPNRRTTREERIYGTKHALEAWRFSSFGLAVVSRSPRARAGQHQAQRQKRPKRPT